MCINELATQKLLLAQVVLDDAVASCEFFFESARNTPST